MQAESGRLIVGVKLSDEIRNTFFSNFVYVTTSSYYADGTVSGWSGMTNLMILHKDDLLTFISQTMINLLHGACVEFKFTICDALQTCTNTFSREICIENGKSIGCVYEVTGDAVVEDITNFNFTFDWEEVDCAPCPSNNYVTTVPRYAYVQQEMLTLCGIEVGSVHDITTVCQINWIR